MNQIKIFVIAGLSLFSLTASAGGNDAGHGGNVVTCMGKPAVVLDYYNATLSTLGGQTPDLIDLSSMFTDDIINFVVDRYKKANLEFSVELVDALKLIGPLSTWTSTSLQANNDSGEAYSLPPGCNKQTAAIRQDNPITMYGDPLILNKLSQAQKGVLVLHEALYLIASQHHQTTSKNVRTFLSILLLKDPKTSTQVPNGQDPLKYAAHLIGGNGDQLFDIDMIQPGVYESSSTYPQRFRVESVNVASRVINISGFSWLECQFGEGCTTSPDSSYPAKFNFVCESKDNALGNHLLCKSPVTVQGCPVYLDVNSWEHFDEPSTSTWLSLIKTCGAPRNSGGEIFMRNNNLN